MKALYNQQEIDTESFSLPITNRGFQYGDGFFETMIFHEGNVKYAQFHAQRIAKAMKILGLISTIEYDEGWLQEKIAYLTNGHHYARCKLTIWRQEGGLYAPSNNNAEILLTVQPMPEPQPLAAVENIAIAQSVRLQPSSTSGFKSLSALNYVLAGQEKQNRRLEEVLLLDQNGNIAEASSANIFWKKGEHYFTPSPATGCIEGVRRAAILTYLSQHQIPFSEVLEKPATLAAAESIYLCNVSQIRHIKKFQKILYNLTDLTNYP